MEIQSFFNLSIIGLTRGLSTKVVKYIIIESSTLEIDY